MYLITCDACGKAGRVKIIPTPHGGTAILIPKGFIELDIMNGAAACCRKHVAKAKTSPLYLRYETGPWPKIGSRS